MMFVFVCFLLDCIEPMWWWTIQRWSLKSERPLMTTPGDHQDSLWVKFLGKSNTQHCTAFPIEKHQGYLKNVKENTEKKILKVLINCRDSSRTYKPILSFDSWDLPTKVPVSKVVFISQPETTGSTEQKSQHCNNTCTVFSQTASATVCSISIRAELGILNVSVVSDI